MADTVTMFPTPIRGRVFQINFVYLEGKPITDAAVQALGIHKHVGWSSESTSLLVLEISTKKLFWVPMNTFTADA